MIPVTRLSEPSILAVNKEKWLTAFLEKRKSKLGARPASRQYGHREIRETLLSIAFGTVFAYQDNRLELYSRRNPLFRGTSMTRRSQSSMKGTL